MQQCSSKAGTETNARQGRAWRRGVDCSVPRLSISDAISDVPLLSSMARFFVCEAALALDHLRANRVVHRDLKVGAC